jgi:hypothetical protein
MAMGTRKQRQRQEELWYRRDLAEAPGHPFYRSLNQVLEGAGFDEIWTISANGEAAHPILHRSGPRITGISFIDP